MTVMLGYDTTSLVITGSRKCRKEDTGKELDNDRIYLVRSRNTLRSAVISPEAHSCIIRKIFLEGGVGPSIYKF